MSNYELMVIFTPVLSEEDFIALVASLESKSNHPIAKAIVEFGGENRQKISLTEIEEIPGHGLKANFSGQTVLAGNSKLLKKFNISYPEEINTIVDSIVLVAMNEVFIGYITVSDEVKEDARLAVDSLKSLNIELIMLSGDKQAVVNDVATKLGITEAFGDLLPEGKVTKVEVLKQDKTRTLAFVGDGINDAFALPALKAGGKVQIFNRWGKRVYEFGVGGKWAPESDIPSGVYFYNIEDGDNSFKGWLEVIR